MQTTKQSWIEALIGTAIGFVVSLTAQHLIVNPTWNLNTGVIESLEITIFFTVLSVVRGYYVRRLFNWLHNKNNKKAADDTIGRNHREGARR